MTVSVKRWSSYGCLETRLKHSISSSGTPRSSSVFADLFKLPLIWLFSPKLCGMALPMDDARELMFPNNLL